MIEELRKLPMVEEVLGLGYLIGIKFSSGNAKPYQQQGLAVEPS